MSRSTRFLAPILGILALALTGCAAPVTAAHDSTRAGDGTTTYPLTIENCGETVTFDQAPERIVLLESAPATILDGLGVLDRVVSLAGPFPDEYYDSGLAGRIDAIDTLSDRIDAAGHLTISAEVVLAQEPDLVLGLPDGLTRTGLLDGGSNTLVQPVYCPTGVEDTSFDSLYEQIEIYGQIFDRNDEAQELVADLKARVTDVESATADAPERTAAVLYPSAGGGPLYAYGRASMSQPQLEAAGFTNVFDDTPERVFEVSIEELIDRDPDVLILLYQGDDGGVEDEVRTLPGSDALRALTESNVLVQLFNFTEPPSPLSVVGLERIVERFGTGS
ncbi:ABC transporter substrate-binding protein [Mycetocola zhujimingii]|uniref:ABC transporter substrate-binding protein n=1 Tax=Mycetocola zhujimingii TaxID=2079792 RepID=UPI000D3B965E|nr:ABC transporter substrate-binding protein [Mycetocola zhujimingii]AWB86324.1 ABC transporter substrate-binding protein [Mycetocola zhujimingii]